MINRRKIIKKNFSDLSYDIVFEAMKLNFVLPLLYVRYRLGCKNNIWIISFLIFNSTSYIMKKIFSSLEFVSNIYENINRIYIFIIIISYLSLIRKDRCKLF